MFRGGSIFVTYHALTSISEIENNMFNRLSSIHVKVMFGHSQTVLFFFVSNESYEGKDVRER